MIGRRFDTYLPRANAAELKAMARLWGGRAQMRKDEAEELILAGLEDPAKVRETLDRLQPFERTALALLRQVGGALQSGTLELVLRVSGIPLPPSSRERLQFGYDGSQPPLVSALLRRGLVLIDSRYDPASQFPLSYRSGVSVFSDERLLAQVGPPEVVPLPLQPSTTPRFSTLRRPAVVVLDAIAVLQAVRDLGGLALTQRGLVRVAELRKLQKTLGWPAQGLELDGLHFPDPARALVGALRMAGLLQPRGNLLVPGESPEAFAARPYGEPVAALLHGFIHNTQWSEMPPSSWDWEREMELQSQGRQVLVLGLAALPEAAEGFFSVDDVDQAMFDRVGDSFSLGFVPPRPVSYNKTPEQQEEAEANWHARRRAAWLERERPWLEQALTTWLYYLGIVELGLTEDALEGVRLTDLGRAVLRPQQGASFDAMEGASDTTPARSAPHAAWLVQPNFEIVVYLDRAAPQQLAFLERHARRVQTQQHTAQYHLTSEPVYQSLESGASVEELLTGLQEGSETELPQNVVTELREWAALREQLTLRRQGHVLEFANTTARQKALDNGLAGTEVGDRFLLVSAPDLAGRRPQRRVDYTRPLAACLTVNEEGVVQCTRRPADLLLEAQLARWAEPLPEGGWRLTESSVRTAVRRGNRVSELFSLLEERLAGPLPPFLAVVLRAWAGVRLEVGVAPVTVLRCPRNEVAQAAAASDLLRPYLQAELAPGVFLVNPEQVEELRQALSWAGLRVSDTLLVEQNS